MKKIYVAAITLFFFLSGCSESEVTQPEDSDNNQNEVQEVVTDNSWLIPAKEVRDGGVGKDGIPALSGPDFSKVYEIDYLDDDDLVLGFVDENDIRAYPHRILDWHEIINDDTKNHSLAVIYCPLTGTGIGWERFVKDGRTTFGVSGLLYNSNIIPYDRETDSHWSQLLLKSVNGELKGAKAKTFNLLETTWKTWKNMYPDTKTVTTQTGFNRDYERYPYGGYKEQDVIYFPVSNIDGRLDPKERVLGVIINEKAKAYQFNNTGTLMVKIDDEFQQEKLVIVKNREANFMVAYKRVLADGTELNFNVVDGELPVILEDNEGTKWDVFGRGHRGPRRGEQLETVPQMMGYWFAFAAFYPELELR